MLYYLTLFFCALAYIAVLLLMNRFSNRKITNLVFAGVILLCYGGLVLTVLLDVGPNDWNFQNVLPAANVSPFMFTTVALYFLMPSKAKNYYHALVALLIFGMIMSPLLSIISRIVSHYAFHIHFVYDYIAHLALSLWGVYLVKSGQIELTTKNTLVGGLSIVTVALIMTSLNVIFGTAFFGLTFDDRHNIYNMVLTENAFLSALLYFGGLIGVLSVGYLLQKMLNKKKIS